MRTASRFGVLAILLVAGFATGTAHAGDNEVTLGGFARSLRSASANAVTDDNLGGGTISIGRSLDLSLAPGLEVWVTGTFARGVANGTLFRSMITEVDSAALTVGGRARYRLHRRLAAGARLDAGTGRTELTLEGAGGTVSDAAWSAVGTAALSLDLLAVTHPRVSLGLRFELGYLAAAAPALSPRGEQDDSKIMLDEMQASIGHLDLGGRFFSFAFLGQF